MNLTIANLKAEDIPQIMKFGGNHPAFEGFWSEETIERFVEDGLSRGIYCEERTLIGFVLATYQPITRKLTWENAYVAPEYRKLNLALDAFQQVWQEGRKRGALFAEAIVKAENTNPERILLKAGFTSRGEHLWYHKFGE